MIFTSKSCLDSDRHYDGGGLKCEHDSQEKTRKEEKTMNNKRYNDLRNLYDEFTSYDMLSRDDMKDLRKDMKERKQNGHIILCDRASYRYTDDGVILTSYYTDVCIINNHNEFHKMWEGYSKTTLKHINLFREMWSLPPMTKKEWILFEEL